MDNNYKSDNYRLSANQDIQNVDKRKKHNNSSLPEYP